MSPQRSSARDTHSNLPLRTQAGFQFGVCGFHPYVIYDYPDGFLAWRSEVALREIHRQPSFR